MGLPIFSSHLPAVLAVLLLGGGGLLKLPAPPTAGVCLSDALKARRSVRAFAPGGPSLAQAAALLWAAQGTNRPDGKRTVASAGATFPLEAYLVTEGSADLPKGTYRYLPKAHQLERLSDAGVGGTFGAVAVQNWIKSAPAVVVLAAAESRTAGRYGSRATRYVAFEAGGAAQSLALAAVAQGLGSGVAGAYDDAAVKKALGLPAEEEVLALLPVGRPLE